MYYDLTVLPRILTVLPRLAVDEIFITGIQVAEETGTGSELWS
jgi:hypothetical protein